MMRLGVDYIGISFSLRENADVVVYHTLYLLMPVVVVISLKVDKSMTHLGVIWATTRLQL